jgi:hypothetical protein
MTINNLKPWTASSNPNQTCWSNGAGLPLKSPASNLPQEASLYSQTQLPLSQAATEQARDTLIPVGPAGVLSSSRPLFFGPRLEPARLQTPPPHSVLSASVTSRGFWGAQEFENLSSLASVQAPGDPSGVCGAWESEPTLAIPWGPQTVPYHPRSGVLRLLTAMPA